jgi:hypothetical protein
VNEYNVLLIHSVYVLYNLKSDGPHMAKKHIRCDAIRLGVVEGNNFTCMCVTVLEFFKHVVNKAEDRSDP